MVQIDIMEAVRRVVRGRWWLLLCLVAGMVIGAGVAMLLPKVYSAQVVFLPPAGSEASIQAVSVFSSRDPSDLYLGMLGSRSVTDDVIRQAGLLAVYKTQSMEAARRQLQRQVIVSVSKNTLITVRVDTHDPFLSATIAESYLNALYSLNGQMAASASSHREEFFHGQLQKEKSDLERAQQELKALQEKTGVVSPVGETEAGLLATSRLQTQIGDAQAKLAALRLSSTEDNPQVQQARAEIGTLQAELRRQQDKGNHTPGTGIAKSGNLPELLMQYANKSRELKYNEALYDSLTLQYQKARLAAIDPGPQLQIVDHSIVPERKSGPPRTLITLGCGFAGFLLGLAKLLFAGPVKSFFRKLNAPAPTPAS